jgi:uncharacterized protein YegP (UPF0339 family)
MWTLVLVVSGTVLLGNGYESKAFCEAAMVEVKTNVEKALCVQVPKTPAGQTWTTSGGTLLLR